MRLFLLLLIVPLVEIGLFIQVGGFIGLWPTLFIVVATAVAGAMLIRLQGLHILSQIRNSVAAGQDPSTALLHGLLVFVSSLLLLTPGFFTDAVGLGLLFPQVRDFVIGIGKSAIVANAGTFTEFRWGTGRNPEETVIEGTARNVDTEQREERR